MQNIFEHLLGLRAETALAILRGAGISDARVELTAAPPRRNPLPEDGLRSPKGEAGGYASTRVVAVKDDGHTLVVARFLTGEPGDSPGTDARE